MQGKKKQKVFPEIQGPIFQRQTDSQREKV